MLNLSNAARNGETITLTGIGSATTATVHGESRTVAISGGAIIDDFAPYAVHIYRVD